MARVFITGSADGLGLMAGQLLAERGHPVTIHARSESRAEDARDPGLQDRLLDHCRDPSGVAPA